jgi:folate-binding Fe-S cluster repair protein YgfZ
MNHKDTEPQRREALLKGLNHLAFWAHVQKASEKSITDILQALRLQVRKLEAKVTAAGKQPPPTSSNTNSANFLASPE